MHFDLSGITHITQDSRAVQAGSLFVALKGEKVDGTQFIPQAEAAGAVAVLVADDAAIPDTNMRVIRAANPRLALAQIAAQFYPKQPKYMVAVTGTDGKTSTADFFRQLAHLAGHKSASIGTLGVFSGDGTKLYEGTHTTPDPISLHKMLQELAEAGYTHVCMEASSHGLDQYRLHGVRLTAAAFTNLTRDHLDYHGDVESYFKAKARLFEELLPKGSVAVLNVDDAHTETWQMTHKNIHRITGYGHTREHWVEYNWQYWWLLLEKIELHPGGIATEIRITKKAWSLFRNFIGGWKSEWIEINIPLVGAFQLYNMLAAVGLLLGCGEKDAEKLIHFLPKLKGVPGRLEHVATTKSGAAVYVDYAHTPAALENILKTLRPHTQNKLHVVFGCGGNRDVGKRPLMSKAANEFADVVIVTDDNPRNEDPAEIRKAIMAACPEAQEIGDRKEAIIQAIGGLGAGDVLVIAGKGHEKTQVIGNKELPHDDGYIAKNAVI